MIGRVRAPKSAKLRLWGAWTLVLALSISGQSRAAKSAKLGLGRVDHLLSPCPGIRHLAPFCLTFLIKECQSVLLSYEKRRCSIPSFLLEKECQSVLLSSQRDVAGPVTVWIGRCMQLLVQQRPHSQPSVRRFNGE